MSAPTFDGVTSLGEVNGDSLAIAPNPSRGIGSVIQSLTSPELIEGVRLAPLTVHPDDRGFFTELARLEPLREAGWQQAQVSATLTYPGTIKALHYHLEQTDLWHPVLGMFQVCLHDLRTGSRTFGTTNTLYVGQLRPWAILIPPGVAHGYKVIGTQSALLVYLTNRHYNPADEGRIPFDHPGIAYDWETQHK